jgi:hypothetical protein
MALYFFNKSWEKVWGRAGESLILQTETNEDHYRP